MEQQKESGIKIEIDEQTSNGIYSNLAMFRHSENEFIIDFIFFQPQDGKAKVRSRIITSPAHAKKILEALKANIAKYEEKFGAIKDVSLKNPNPNQKQEYYN
jgi:hypothetical protein